MSLYVQIVGEGPDLAMIHGWGMHGGVWGPVLESLSASYRMHLVDLPGLGNSKTIAPYTLEKLSEAVAEVLPETTAVCGWSLGGQVALRLALDHPGRIDKLVLVGATPKFINADGWNCGIAAEIFCEFAAQVQRDYRETLSRFLALQAHGGEATRDTIRRLREQFFTRTEPCRQDLQAGLDVLLQTDLREDLVRMNIQTLIVHGEHDKLAPVGAGRWLAGHLPAARLQICKGASHAPFLSHPAWFAERVKDFIGG